jgi:hypothetical protein
MKQHIITESNADYHARDCISASRLKLLRESPRKYEAEVIERRIRRAESLPMKLGTAIHAMVLEPDTFGDQYVICPDECSDKRTKLYKEWAATAGDKIVLNMAEKETIFSAWNAVMRHQIAGRIVAGMDHAEGSILYDDDETGAACRFRFDGIAGLVIFDLKTVADIRESFVNKQFFEYGYHVQAAHYIAGMNAVAPGNDWQFRFIFVETSEPFRCEVVEMDESVIDAGMAERRELIDSLIRRTETGDWSEACEKRVRRVFLPNWYKGLVTV